MLGDESRVRPLRPVRDQVSGFSVESFGFGVDIFGFRARKGAPCCLARKIGASGSGELELRVPNSSFGFQFPGLASGFGIQVWKLRFGPEGEGARVDGSGLRRQGSEGKWCRCFRWFKD